MRVARERLVTDSANAVEDVAFDLDDLVTISGAAVRAYDADATFRLRKESTASTGYLKQYTTHFSVGR